MLYLYLCSVGSNVWLTQLLCIQVVEGKSEEKKHDVVPRQFMDLGPSDEISHSSSDERTRSGSPQNNTEVASVKNNGKLEIDPYDQETSSLRDVKRNGGEESPESESHGWNNANKVQKLNSANKGIDQSTEATMRKARVSVRARSEAPMVCR